MDLRLRFSQRKMEFLQDRSKEYAEVLLAKIMEAFAVEIFLFLLSLLSLCTKAVGIVDKCGVGVVDGNVFFMGAL